MMMQYFEIIMSYTAIKILYSDITMPYHKNTILCHSIILLDVNTQFITRKYTGQQYQTGIVQNHIIIIRPLYILHY